MTAARPPRARPLRLTITLTANWRRAWRMLSVQIAALACGFGLLPPDQQAALLAAVGVPEHRLPLALGLLFLAARLVGQPAVEAQRGVPETSFGNMPPANHPDRAEPVKAPAGLEKPHP
jgi:hypothetical protein